MVHSSDTDPCEDAIAALHGCGLREEDLVKSFGKMLRRVLSSKVWESKRMPVTPDELLEMLDNGPSPILYNAIYSSIYDNISVNEYGYAKTNSNIMATKIWSSASDWESLITKNDSPKQIITGLVIHRLTDSNEVLKILHKCNHTISDEKVRTQNGCWARMMSINHIHIPSLRKGVVTPLITMTDVKKQ